MVGIEHAIKGQGIYAYVTLLDGVEYTLELKKELIACVRSTIGPFAARTQYIGLLTCPKLEVVKYSKDSCAKLRAKMILSVIHPRWQIKVLLRNLCDYVMFEFEVCR